MRWTCVTSGRAYYAERQLASNDPVSGNRGARRGTAPQVTAPWRRTHRRVPARTGSSRPASHLRRVMSAAPQDPAKWLRDLMKAEPAALWPPIDIADTGKAMAAAAAPWTKAVADF